MDVLYNRQWYTTTFKKDDEDLCVESHYLDTFKEAAFRFIVDVHSFMIKDAIWEVYRSNEGKDANISKKFPELIGLAAYFGIGKELHKISWDGETQQILFEEGINAVIQSENFLLTERKFVSDNEYEKYWKKMYLNSCRYYSNLDKVKVTFTRHIAPQTRFGRLFSRYRACTMYDAGDKFVLLGIFQDSFHELNMTLKIDKKSNSVIDAFCQIVRAPDSVCLSAANYAQNMVGYTMRPPITKKVLSKYLGGKNACVHMLSLAVDLGQTIDLYKREVK